MLHVTIRAKIGAGFASLLVLVGIIGWVSVGNLGKVNNLMGSMYEESLIPIQEIGGAVAELRQLQLYLVDDVLTQDKAKMDEAEQMIAEHEKLMLEHLDRYGKSNLSPEEKALLAGFNESWPLYKADRDAVLRLKRESKDISTMTPFVGIARQRLASLDEVLNKLTQLNVAAAKEARQQGESTYATTYPTTMGMVGLAILLALGVGLLLTRSIAHGIDAAAQAAEGLAQGDTGQQLQVRSRDELGRMAVSFNRMVDYLRDMAAVAEAVSHGDLTQQVQPRSERDALGVAFERMISNLRQMVGSVATSASTLAEASQEMSGASGQTDSATQQIARNIQEVARGNQEQSRVVLEAASSVDQLTRAVDQIARGAQEQAKSLEQASSSVSQLNGSIAQAAAASREVSSATEQANQAAQAGANSVDMTIQGMGAIRKSTIDATREIQDLDKYSEQINSIVETIDDIAEQTNLLALNAAIEAARAGEHGRGFAVVAEEVRKLAERSSVSTREIAELVAQVQRETQEAVAAIQVGMKEVEAGSALAEEAGAALKNILSAVQAASGQVGHIVSAVQQMEAASQQVVGVMDSVSGVAEESAAATGEMAASSKLVSSAIEKVAAVSEETSASAEEVSASTQEMSAQVQQMVAHAHGLAEMAEGLQAAVDQFQTDQAAEVVMRRRQDDWGDEHPEAASEKKDLRPAT